MSRTVRRIKTYKKAKETICSFYDYTNNSILIHYSCESFYNIKDGRTPRITSIAIRFLNSSQTISFSIHKVAELKGIEHSEITEKYDELEKLMLTEFYLFVNEHRTFRWLHWNMRDINFGFEAIKHRALVLGVNTFEISDENKYDFSRLLIEKYGKKYASHPRLQCLVELNKISSKNWLDGEDEAKAFDNKEYVKLHQSTLAKVNVMENLLKLTAEEDLKTNAKLIDIYGLSPQGIFELIKDNWIYSSIIFILTTFVSYLISINTSK
jgi:hypothetical protein